jgi:hypothetical protein
MLSIIFFIALAALSEAAPTLPGYSNSSSAFNNQSTTDIESSCGTPNEFIIRGLNTWTPAYNNTNRNVAAHFYMEFHDLANNLHTPCFDDPLTGRFFDATTFKYCENKKVQFMWIPSHYGSGSALSIVEAFTPCNPW